MLVKDIIIGLMLTLLFGWGLFTFGYGLITTTNTPLNESYSFLNQTLYSGIYNVSSQGEEMESNVSSGGSTSIGGVNPADYLLNPVKAIKIPFRLFHFSYDLFTQVNKLIGIPSLYADVTAAVILIIIVLAFIGLIFRKDF